MRRFCILIGLLAGVACRGALSATDASSSAVGPWPPGSTPSGPSITSPSVLTFVSGESLEPVASARVTIGGRSYVTDGGGRVATDRTATLVDVQASGFFDRRALLSADRFSLWPNASPSGLDVEYTARLVYNCTAAGCADGGEPLGRVPQGMVSVRPSRELRDDPDALAALEEGVQLWTAATRGEVAFARSIPSAPGTVEVTVDVDPADPVIVSRGAAGVTRRDYAGAAISRARITLRSVSLARRLPLLVHELGHAFGLAHSPRLGDVMWNGPELYDSIDLSASEKVVVALMLQRASGNRFPDNEDHLLAARGSSARPTAVVSCFER